MQKNKIFNETELKRELHILLMFSHLQENDFPNFKSNINGFKQNATSNKRDITLSLSKQLKTIVERHKELLHRPSELWFEMLLLAKHFLDLNLRFVQGGEDLIRLTTLSHSIEQEPSKTLADFSMLKPH